MNAPADIKLTQSAAFVTFGLCFSGIQGVLFPGPTIRVAIQFLIVILMFLALMHAQRYNLQSAIETPSTLRLFEVGTVLVLIHSLIFAADYEQWRYIATVFMPVYLLAGIGRLAASPKAFAVSLRVLLLIAPALSCAFYFQDNSDKVARLTYINYVAFIYLLIPFIWSMPSRPALLVVALSALSLSFDLDSRSNVANIILSYILFAIAGACAKFGIYRSPAFILMLGLARRILLLAPLVLVVAGGLFDFNIFRAAAELTDPAKGSETSSGRAVTVDSRSSIYSDLLLTMATPADWIIGVGAGTRHETELADTLEGYESGRIGGSESGLIGFLKFGGLLYAGVIFFIFSRASYLALYRSNNYACKILALYIAVRWAYLFIENPVELNLYWASTFWAVGIALSASFRQMDDADLKEYFSSVFHGSLFSRSV